MTKKLVYFAAVLICILLPIVAYFSVSTAGEPFGPDSEFEYVRARVTEITNTEITSLDDGGTMVDTVHTFNATVKSGELKGETITATQMISSYAVFNPRPVSVGDKVVVYETSIGGVTAWSFAEYVRSDTIIVLCVLFCAALVIFGRSKGLKTLVSLVLTLASVFLVLIPAILTGANVYLWTIIICLYIVAMTLIIVNGLTDMSLVAGLGCIGGVLLSAAITLIMDVFLKLTGYTDEHTIYIQSINNGAIDVKALVFAGILIGAIGAVMDVAVNISASLREISLKVKSATFSELFKSGMTISRDIIGTMSNTLILAYVGSSLCAVLLIIYNNSFSLLNLFNKENIIIEILKIIVGSFGILFALPLTSFISALFYSKRKSGNTCGKGQINGISSELENCPSDSCKKLEKKEADEETDEFVELLRSVEEKE